MHHFPYFEALFRNYQAAVIDSRISPNDPMNNQFYSDAGKSAVDNIVLACLASDLKEIKRILDIPCGYGRVLRHLIHLFPGAEFHACDLDVGGVDFCASTFGARAVYSREELTQVDFGCQYDVIWVGSLFTHTAQDVTRRWMSHLARFLSPTGIVVATLHGRWSRYVHKVAPYIEEAQWRQIVEDYLKAGYGYQDYLGHGLPHISGSYGVSLAKPHVTIRNVEDIAGIRILFYRERGWVDHHDVVAFGHPSYDLP